MSQCVASIPYPIWFALAIIGVICLAWTLMASAARNGIALNAPMDPMHDAAYGIGGPSFAPIEGSDFELTRLTALAMGIPITIGQSTTPSKEGFLFDDSAGMRGWWRPLSNQDQCRSMVRRFGLEVEQDPGELIWNARDKTGYYRGMDERWHRAICRCVAEIQRGGA